MARPLYIFPAHLLKTWAAVRDEIALGVPDATAQALRAAVNRLFGARFKQRHVLRTAHQALGLTRPGKTEPAHRARLRGARGWRRQRRLPAPGD